MKNKEIEELLNEFKEGTHLFPEYREIILSHIEQLEKEYNRSLDKLRNLRVENEQLKHNRDKAIEFGNGLLLGEATFEERHIASRFLNILKGDSE